MNNMKDIIEYFKDCTLIDLYHYRIELYWNSLGYNKSELNYKITNLELVIIARVNGYELITNLKKISRMRFKIGYEKKHITDKIDDLQELITAANSCEEILGLPKNCLLYFEEIVSFNVIQFLDQLENWNNDITISINNFQKPVSFMDINKRLKF